MSGNVNHQQKMRVSRHAVKVALLSAVVAFGILQIIASNFNVGKIPLVIYYQKQIGWYGFLTRSKTASAAKFKMATLHCKTACSKLTGLCVPLDLAVFVLRNSSTSTLQFKQRTYPMVRVSERNNNSTSKPSSENCYMEDHFPGMELIPRQGSCAVVGNGGILNNSSCGDIIDSYDFVIRANMAKIKGYEKDVGNKTDLTAINLTLLRKYSAAISEAHKSSKSRDVRDRFLDQVSLLGKSILWYPKPLHANKKNVLRLFDKYITPKTDNAEKFRTIIKAIQSNGSSDLRYAFSWKPISIEKEWKTGKIGTLGFDLFVVAGTFCDNISLFGFYPFYEDPHGKPLKYHYYEDVEYGFSKTDVHNFSREYEILQKLNAEDKLKLVVGSCN